MQSNYFTLRALAHEWNDALGGARFAEAYSSSRGEVTLVFEREGETLPLRVGTVAPDIYAFLATSAGRPRRNSASFFETIRDSVVERVRSADLDRHVFVHLQNGDFFQLVLFGTRANVLLVGRDGVIVEAFRSSGSIVGHSAPEPRPASLPSTAEDLDAAIRRSGPGEDFGKVLRRAIPVLDADLARELAYRMDASDARSAEDRFGAWETLHQQLLAPSSTIVSDGESERFSLVALEHAPVEKRYETVNEGVSTVVRRNLGRGAFERRYTPLVKSIERMSAAAGARVEAMADELARPSRADEYERAGHLLMALPDAPKSGAESIDVDDLFEGGTLTIDLDSELSHVENALRYYEKAKAVRQRRQAAEDRFDGEVAASEKWAQLLDEAQQVSTISDLDAFEKHHSDSLSALRSKSGSQESRPYREIEVGGFQVWIGKSARHNDTLTFGFARKHDLWLHARGVPGSHVIVRVNKGQVVPSPVLERIASIAAWHSKARGSGLVPVIVAERKHVRKVKGGHPGAVIVERERVLTVEPASATE
jgi:predicted ribosome quality control (RQC) complex YloA/Tae2 family protein